jgi:putative transposase
VDVIVDEVGDILCEFGCTAHIRPRGEEAKAIKREAGFKARSFVVGRAHSWMNRFRRLLVRWEKKPENYLALLHVACGLIAFRVAGLFG